MTLPKSLIVLALCFLNTCASPDAGECPVDLDQLAPLISDLQLAESLSTEVPAPVRDSMLEVYFDNVLADYDYDRKTFDSLTWIVRSEPAWINELYTKVGVLMAKEEAKQ